MGKRDDQNGRRRANAPMITIYSNRIEILSRGTIAPKQTMEGFYKGESVPVNQGLSDMFLQLHISERSGRGVPKITKVYGKEAFEFRKNSIVVTIPFNRKDGDAWNKQKRILESTIKISKGKGVEGEKNYENEEKSACSSNNSCTCAALCVRQQS